MKDGEMSVDRGVHVELDNIGAQIKRGFDRCDRVFQMKMGRRMHAARRAVSTVTPVKSNLSHPLDGQAVSGRRLAATLIGWNS
jgi:hypothetical protein